MKTYQMYVKSHCEAPDIEIEVQAKNKWDAVDKIYQKVKRYDWTKDEIRRSTEEIV